jgi:UDP-sulfoquinovose synthase
MRILILGGDGYLGWPTAMHFAARGHGVTVIDNYLRRTLALQTRSEPLIDAPDLEQRAEIFRQVTGCGVEVRIGDCADYPFLESIFRETQPEVVIHYAEQPSAPYSMRGYAEASLTLRNNLATTLNVVWAIREAAPSCHLIKLGTMGEYGTPAIEIEEGWIEIEHKGRRDRFLYPRQAGSLYHTTKIMDTDLIWFYVRMWNLQATDLMQGPVYGLSMPEADRDERLLPNFHYDDLFGTLVNRFLVQAVAGIPLTVYGRGGQTRGYLNLLDTLQCVELAATHPPGEGQLRILNQFTECFTVNELAAWVQRAGQSLGLRVEIQHLKNPRKEAEEHFYKPAHSGLLELGLRPHPISEEILCGMLERILPYKNRIDSERIYPRVRW